MYVTITKLPLDEVARIGIQNFRNCMRFSTLPRGQIQPPKHHLQPVTTDQLGVDFVFFEEAGLCIKNPRLLMKGEKDSKV